MATVTQESIGVLHEKLNITINKEDYLPAFEKAIKEYSRKANMPGFRKGQVPAGLIKKMYGSSVYTDEILRSVDRELMKYLDENKMDIFAQPLPVDFNVRDLNMNNPANYTFTFEVGRKPEFKLPDLSKEKFTKFKVNVTDELIDNEISRLQNRYGNMKQLDTIESVENVLNVTFLEVDENANETENGIKKDNSLLVKYFNESFQKELLGKHIEDYVVLQLDKAFDEKEKEWLITDLELDKNDPAAMQKHFKMVITKIGLLEKRELDQEFYKQLFPGEAIENEAGFREKIAAGIQSQWDAQSRNQIHDQIYHVLIDHTDIAFPEPFLKKWMKSQGDQPKEDDVVEKEFPSFLNQLKWTLITEKIVTDNSINVTQEELRDFAKQQLMGYMGMQMDEDQAWVKDYIDKMMKDRKYLDDAYHRIQVQKIFEWAEQQVSPVEQQISVEEFTKMQQEHNHAHH